MFEYILITSQCTFWKDPQWVAQLHSGHIVNKFVKEPRVFIQKVATGYIVIRVVDTFWKNSQRVAQPCGGHILSKIVKESKGPIQKVSPGRFSDYFLKEISMYPLDTDWLNCLRNHNEITMYPLDKSTLSPSVSGLAC